jgi:hypothetical protein
VSSDEQNRLAALHVQATSAFDKLVAALSSGALALSITFVHQLAPNPHHAGYLLASWVLFAAALVASLWSFLTSERAASAYYYAVGDGDVPRSKWEVATQVLNWAAALMLTAAVALLVLFAWKNVPAVSPKKSPSSTAIVKTTGNPVLRPKPAKESPKKGK